MAVYNDIWIVIDIEPDVKGANTIMQLKIRRSVLTHRIPRSSHLKERHALMRARNRHVAELGPIRNRVHPVAQWWILGRKTVDCPRTGAPSIGISRFVTMN